MNSMKLLRTEFWIILILFFVWLSLEMTYSIHDDYHLPYHSDEWDHIAIASEITRTDQLVNYNPYSRTGWDPQWEQNYHIFMATIMNVTDWDVVDLGGVYTALFIPVLMTFLMIFFSFLLARYLTNSTACGIIAAITVLLTRPNANILGYWFSVPMAYGMAFIPLILYVFAKAFSSKGYGYFIVLLVLLAQGTLVHPASVTIFFPAFAIYFLLSPKLLWQNKKKILLIVVEFIALISLLVGYSVFQYSFTGYSDLYQTLMQTISFTTSLYEVQAYYFLPRFITWPIFLLGMLGVASLFLSKKKEARILPLLALTLIAGVYLFFTEGRIFLSDYRRVFMYAAMLTSLLSGIGIYAIASFFLNPLKKRLKNYFIFTKKFPIVAVPQAIAVVLIAWFLFLQITFIPFTHVNMLYKVIEEEDVPAILWLKHNTSIDEVVLAMPYHSRGIYGIAGNLILYANMARLRGPRGENEPREFWAVSCEQRAKLLYGNPKYIYCVGPYQCPLDCKFLKEVYAKDSRYIYEIKR
ncbi:MAG: hypothetical protein ABIE23_05855 [archaeon]|nr:hypothetical protein [Candidatus Micrarchaeota archaeon]